MEKFNFQKVAGLWRQEKRELVKRSTMSAYSLILENHLLPSFGRMLHLTEKSVQDFVFRKIENGLSQKSVKDALFVLKMVTRYGEKKGMLPHYEWDIKFPTEQPSSELPVISVEHQRKLMRYLLNHFSFRNLGIFICLHTGMRIGELCAMQWRDVDLRRDVITVSKTVERIYVVEGRQKHTELIVSSPKTPNSHREIPISKELRRVLKPLMCFAEPDFYVLTNKATPTEPRTYRAYYKRLMETLRLPCIKFHGLRHSFATRCIESKCDYKTVSVILGHSNIATTLNLYVHPDMEQKKRCIERMNKILGRL
ncbi:MAG: site-specific integrase [Bacteroides sp.]|nr:site-specific integrase [Ruminococcus flavefaciens]MCM1554964.1 site-specific integrase [Bacteroides sp.]